MLKGDIYSFSGYKWRVLDVQSDKVLLLSENVLEKKRYHESYVDTTWENSTLRKYLNDEFYDKFSLTEKTKIVETKIENRNNPWFNINAGNDTTDKIFLLSIEEVVKYFGCSEQLNNVPKNKSWIDDQYNTAREAKNTKGEECWWWLRSPGIRKSNATLVYDDGTLRISGFSVNYNGGGVRPSLWLNM